MWCWRRIEKIIWTNLVRNEDFLKGNEDRNILQTIKIKKVDCVGHIFRRNCLIKHVIEGKREGKKDAT
jgi:hypothetical protein